MDLLSCTAPPAADGADPLYRERARVAAEKFEGFFIAELMKQMRRSTRELSGDEGLFQDRVNDDMLSMADTMVADTLAGQHAFGIADAILRQLLPAEALPLNAAADPVALSDKTAALRTQP